MTRRNGRRPVPMLTPEAAEQRKLEKLRQMVEDGEVTRECEPCGVTEELCLEHSMEKGEPVFHHKE